MICITGNSSHLKCTLFPPLDLSSSTDWEIAFFDLMTYNSIPNVEENINNKIKIGDTVLSLPTGSYEIDNICNFIKKELETKKPSVTFQLVANNSTLKSELICSEEVRFPSEHSLGPLLGWTDDSEDPLTPNIWHKSPNQVNINKVDVIRLTCDIVQGSYRDGVEGHVLHEFYPTVEPGFKIVEKPNIVKYLPINRQTVLSEFNIRLEDQDGRLVNFRGERINLRVDIRSK